MKHPSLIVYPVQKIFNIRKLREIWFEILKETFTKEFASINGQLLVDRLYLLQKKPFCRLFNSEEVMEELFFFER